uniref:RING-type domain-containing protein n=1 Tax=Oncorhynchus mykiss TaxID=8022 RepID=A0A8C7Q568_ONCMY
MASEGSSSISSPVVRQIDQQSLICSICLDRYDNPKVLPCLHTLCERCLPNYIPAHSLTLSCPVCRQTSILPEKGVAALQSNFFITNLMDVLHRPPSDSCSQESAVLETINSMATGQPLSCPNHVGYNDRQTLSLALTHTHTHLIMSIHQCPYNVIAGVNYSTDRSPY